MFISGLKSRYELLTSPLWAFPRVPVLSNFKNVLTSEISIYFKNSVIVMVISVILILFISSLASYVFSRINFRFNKIIFSLIVAGIAIPIHITLIPIYILIRDIGLYNSIFALIGPYVAFHIPLSIFILTEYMKTIPKELEEAAYIDGCNLKLTFFKIVLPLSKPALVTLGIYNAIMIWNEFVFVLVLISSPANRTLPLGIWEFQTRYQADIPKIMAFLTLASLPLIIVYLFASEKIEKGMVAGALKQ
ncbi:MAG: L-arabinose transport system permease protein AraQ [Firmicutes bacterium ADurb.Bin419]|nr:MAG: L-arabinose transport system permease protein AraQ [Firmicutes bacterium ADurb.Bin419]